MDLNRFLRIAGRWWWLIAASALVAALTSFLVTRSSPAIYQSRTTLMVGQALSQSLNPDYSTFYTSEALAKSYSDLALREPVLRGALDALGLKWEWQTLKGMVNARVVAGTQLLEILVIDTDRVRAKALAGEMARQLILQSPAAADPEKENQRKFAADQAAKLQESITKANQEIQDLDDAIAKSNSARQIQDARSRQATLQAQVTTWQSTYAQLISNLSTGASNTLRVVEEAALPGSPIGPNLPNNVLLATLIGLALGATATLALDFIDDTLKNTDDIADVTKIPVMAQVPRIGKLGDAPPSRVALLKESASPAVEAYRLLRTNLQYASIDTPLKTLMITSATPAEGKSVTAANLAVSVAQTGKRVVLVDADLRRPTQHLLLDRPGERGLTDALLSPGADPMNYAQKIADVGELYFIASGALPPNPPELLGSKRMAEIVAQLAAQADLVIFDALPVLHLSDGVTLGAHIDGALVVARMNRTRRGSLKEAVITLQSLGIRVAGVVFNGLPANRRSNYSYYYYYRDRDEREKLSALQRITQRFKKRQ